VQPEEHGPRSAEGGEQVAVAGELAGQDAELFAAGVVLQEERHHPIALLPQPVPVWSDPRLVGAQQARIGAGEGSGPLAGGLGQPLPETGAGMGAGVSGEVGEELIDAEPMREGPGRRPPAPLQACVVASRGSQVASKVKCSSVPQTAERTIGAPRPKPWKNCATTWATKSPRSASSQLTGPSVLRARRDSNP
jgi:hypothetical protein